MRLRGLGVDAREASLNQRAQNPQDREAKVQELLASLDKSVFTPRALSPQQAQLELKQLRSAPPPVAAAPEPVAVKSRLEKLDPLRGALGKASVELEAVTK